MNPTIYDLIILGGGCAGLSAGVYAGRARLKTLILEKHKPGGQAANTAEVENYPGIRKTLGPTLTADMLEHAKDFGVEYVTAEISDVLLQGDVKTVRTDRGDYSARAVIIATGANPKRVGFEGESEFTGRGVGYCATCDGEFFKGLDIFVVGGGYAAAEEAVYLTRYGKSVTIVMITEDFTCARAVAEKALRHPKIKIMNNTRVVRVSGDGLLRRIEFENLKTGEKTSYEPEDKNSTFGVFVFAGYEPATELFRGKVRTDEEGYILTDDAMRTDVPGVFAAGDLRPKILRQIVTAVADGAVAATSAERYVTELKERLGLPMFEESESRADEEKATPVPRKPADEPTQVRKPAGKFINETLADRLIPIFGKMTKEVTLAVLHDPENEKSRELAEFLTETAAVAPKLKLEFLRKGTDPEREARLGLRLAPSFAVLDENGRAPGVVFSGIPGGHEMNSFVLAVYRMGTEPPFPPDREAMLAKITKPVKIQIGISLTCTFCPETVAAAQLLAMKSPMVTAEMVDVYLFPEIRDRYRIMSVPVLIFNDGEKILFGAKTLDDILQTAVALSE